MKKALHSKTFLVDTEPGPIWIDEDYFKPQIKCRIKLLISPKLRMGVKVVVSIHDLVWVSVQIENLQVRIWFKIVQNLARNVLIRTTYIEKGIWEASLIEHRLGLPIRLLLLYSEPVLRPMWHLSCRKESLYMRKKNTQRFEMQSSSQVWPNRNPQ